jgi:hypothetical protein
MKILVVEGEICQQEWLTRNLSNTGHESHYRVRRGQTGSRNCSEEGRREKEITRGDAPESLSSLTYPLAKPKMSAKWRIPYL